MRNPVIVAIRAEIKPKIAAKYLDMHASRTVGLYKVYKIGPKLQIRPIDETIDRNALMFADAAYNTANQMFMKSRFGSSLSAFPNDLIKVYSPICDIIGNKMSFQQLAEQYPRDVIIQAIFLSDTYSQYCEDIDPVEYQLIRHKFGKDIPTNIKQEILEKYPEKLI